jgi:hypothetical protein
LLGSNDVEGKNLGFDRRAPGGHSSVKLASFVDSDKSKNLPCALYGKPGYCVPNLYKPEEEPNASTDLSIDRYITIVEGHGRRKSEQ